MGKVMLTKKLEVNCQGYLFFSALVPRPHMSVLGRRPVGPQNFIVIDEVFQKYNIHYQQKNFSYLVCTRYIYRLAICQLQHWHSAINKRN